MRRMKNSTRGARIPSSVATPQRTSVEMATDNSNNNNDNNNNKNNTDKKYPTFRFPSKKEKNRRGTNERKGGGGSFFLRILSKSSQPTVATPPAKPASREIRTHATEASESLSEKQSLPSFGRVSSYAEETNETHELSEYSLVHVLEHVSERNSIKAPQRSVMLPPASTRVLVDTTAIVPFSESSSRRSTRTTGNESVGDVKPDQPRHVGFPSLLGNNDESSSASESTCSGLTMDFTFDNSKLPSKQPVGRLGEGVVRERSSIVLGAPPTFFAPPSFITTADEDIDALSLGD